MRCAPRPPADPRAAIDSDDDEVVCWVCLEGELAGRPLVRPCRCPRSVHRDCLATWQLHSYGKREGTACRFCSEMLPALWKPDAAPCRAREELSVAPVMQVRYNGPEGTREFKLRVRPGPEGLATFKAHLKQLLGFDIGPEFDVSFECQMPATGSTVVLSGLNAYGAATHCAAVLAATKSAAAAAAGAPAPGTVAAAQPAHTLQPARSSSRSRRIASAPASHPAAAGSPPSSASATVAEPAAAAVPGPSACSRRAAPAPHVALPLVSTSMPALHQELPQRAGRRPCQTGYHNVPLGEVPATWCGGGLAAVLDTAWLRRRQVDEPTADVALVSDDSKDERPCPRSSARAQLPALAAQPREGRGSAEAQPSLAEGAPASPRGSLDLASWRHAAAPLPTIAPATPPSSVPAAPAVIDARCAAALLAPRRAPTAERRAAAAVRPASPMMCPTSSTSCCGPVSSNGASVSGSLLFGRHSRPTSIADGDCVRTGGLAVTSMTPCEAASQQHPQQQVQQQQVQQPSGTQRPRAASPKRARLPEIAKRMLRALRNGKD